MERPAACTLSFPDCSPLLIPNTPLDQMDFRMRFHYSFSLIPRVYLESMENLAVTESINRGANSSRFISETEPPAPFNRKPESNRILMRTKKDHHSLHALILLPPKPNKSLQLTVYMRHSYCFRSRRAVPPPSLSLLR